MRTLLIAGMCAVGVGLALRFPASTPAIRDPDGTRVPGSITAIEAVELNGVDQWLVIRGRDRRNPVLLFLHGGPGTPESAWLAHYNQSLEDDFVVVSWEQRGAGKSYAAGRARPAGMTAEQLQDDTHALTGYLKERFDQDRIYLVGHSWGTVLGIRAVQRHPENYHAFVSIAQTAHAAREEAAMHTWVLERARQDANCRAISQLESLEVASPGGPTLMDLSVRLKWVNRYGGGLMHRPGAFRELAWVMARRPEYSPWEKLRYFRGESFSLAHLYDDVASIDLFAEIPAVNAPVVFVHGRHDYQVPMEVARDFYEALDAPAKEFVVFDDSAHSPLFEEPERFHRLMRGLRDRAGARRDASLRGPAHPSQHPPRDRSTP